MVNGGYDRDLYGDTGAFVPYAGGFQCRRACCTNATVNKARAFLALFSVLAAACGGAGQYGFSREYVPLDEEETHIETASAVTYEEVRRDPADYRDDVVAWFGVVTAVDAQPNGSARVAMTYRAHQDRHLCGDERDSSCRVTVSERPGGPFSALLEVRPEDREGQDRLWIGSLLKVYGTPTADFDDQGGPILQTRYYRHWPRGTYVTTGASATMRR